MSGPFTTAAHHYLAGRPPYAPALIERLVGLCDLGRADRVMDLGCGPGQLARAFAPYVEEVAALDPGPGMLAIARDLGGAGITWHQAGSADLPGDFGRFKLVVMGRSFHWMDRAETLRRLEPMVVSGGALALVHDVHPELPDNGWYAEFHAILERYGGSDAFRVRRRTSGWVRHEGPLLESTFSALEETGIYERRPLPVEQLIERALSMSSTSRFHLGDRADAMIADIRAAFGPGLSEVVVSHALIARRGR